ncbi:MAG: hypothetical protein JWO69_580 [Thermoleophilia bacterium]|jgi:hypothetical protein|nr:hypothetical protein [Thermoleophilia bacterium]
MSVGEISSGLPPVTGTAQASAGAPVSNAPVASPAPTPKASATGFDKQPASDGWNDKWAKRFHDAGAPVALVAQLNYTGAMGASNEQLEQVLTEVKAEVDAKLAAFEAAYPEVYPKLVAHSKSEHGGAALKTGTSMVFGVEELVNQLKGGSAGSGRAGLVDLADFAATTKLTPAEFGKKLNEVEAQADAMGSYEGIGLAKTYAAGAVIPGYGFYRASAGMLAGGRDPLTQERLTWDPAGAAMTVLWGVGSTITIANQVRNSRQIREGAQLLRRDPAMATSLGVDNLAGPMKYVAPWTKNSRVLAAAGRFERLQDAARTLPEGSLERRLADNFLDAWKTGKVTVQGDAIVKPGVMGLFPRWRGMIPGIGNRGKELVTTSVEGNVQKFLIDGRFDTKEWLRNPQQAKAGIAAHLAGLGSYTAVDTPGDPLRTDLEKSFARGGGTVDTSKGRSERVVASAVAKQRATGTLGAKSVKDTIMAKLRPGPIEDAARAAKNIAAGTPLRASWFKGLPTGGRWAVGAAGTVVAAAALLGVGYLALFKPMADNLTEAQKRVAEEQAAAAAANPETAVATAPVPAEETAAPAA